MVKPFKSGKSSLGKWSCNEREVLVVLDLKGLKWWLPCEIFTCWEVCETVLEQTQLVVVDQLEVDLRQVVAPLQANVGL